MSRDRERQGWDFPSSNLVHSLLQLLTNLAIKDLKQKHCPTALLLFSCWFGFLSYFFLQIYTLPAIISKKEESKPFMLSYHILLDFCNVTVS